MSEKSIEVRQSKKYLIFVCIGISIIIAVITSCIGLFLNALINDKPTKDNIIGLAICICGSLCFLMIFFTLLLYVIYCYKKQVDIYTIEKLIRKRGKKIIFELPYNNIVTVREGFESVFMVLKTHITEANGKKGTRNFYAHYSRADISRIKSMITDKYYNITFN